MAHVGKRYKLWFRRDLSLNQQNVNGWPEAYNCQVSGIRGTFMGSAGILTGLALNTNKDPGDTREWTQGPVPLLGRMFTTVFKILGNPNDGLKTVRVKTTEQASGEYVEWEGTVNSRPFDYDAFDLVPPNLVLHQSPPHMILQGQQAVGVHAAPWADYNP